MILPDLVQSIINTLESHGFEAFAAGGAVRDYLLGREPTDWDIATSAEPQAVIEILGEKACIPTGIKHGTVTYVSSHKAVEITTYRIDGEYQDNRHPESVMFSKNIADDLSRRDFTVNAMAYNPAIGIVDLFGGQNDLNARLIRTVGKPDKRFAEDGLRIIRGLRFSAVLGFEIEAETKTAIHQHKNLLKNIARERIQAELSKLVMSDNPQSVLIEFSDVFAVIFDDCPDFCQSKWAENAVLLSGCTSSLPVRLAVLFDRIGGNQPLHVLRYDNKTIRAVKTILNYLDLTIAPNSIVVKHILSEIGANMLRLVLEAKKAKYNDNILVINDIIDEIISTNQCYLQKDLAIDGNDLIVLGIADTQIGIMLKFLLNEVIEEKCENERSALITLIQKTK